MLGPFKKGGGTVTSCSRPAFSLCRRYLRRSSFALPFLVTPLSPAIVVAFVFAATSCKMSEWEASCVDDALLERWTTVGMIPPKDSAGWVAGYGHVVPAPPPGKIVSFLAYHERGLGLPVSSFFRGVLNQYGARLHQLAPNGVLHAAVFVTLCEAYLGIRPSLLLWRYFFLASLQTSKETGVGKRVGGVSIMLRARESQEYIEVDLKTSLKGWRGSWFYINNADPQLPAFEDAVPRATGSWKSKLSAAEVETIRPHLEAIRRLRDQGLTGTMVFGVAMRRRIMPLRRRVHSIGEYEGPDDEICEVRGRPLSDKGVLARTSAVFKDAEDGLNGGPRPLDRDHRQLVSAALLL